MSARAPYNFIPIKNDEVINVSPFLENRYNQNLYTGYIEFKIKTLTPVYVRDGVPIDEYGKENKNNTDFFNINGKYLIPGSSLKGMIRTLIEIVTFSKFKFFDDKRLYYRLVAAKTDLRIAKQYRERMVVNIKGSSGRPRSRSKAKPGFLFKQGKDYYIIPAKNGNYRIEHGARRKDCKEPGFVRIGNTYYVCSGRMPNKRHHYSFTLPDNPESKKIKLSDSDVNDYKNDINRMEGMNLLDKLKHEKYVPCFYITYQGNKYAFGHNPFFRLPYEKTTGQFIPDYNKEIDIAESIFGVENDDKNNGTAGKVFFESAVLEGTPKFEVDNPVCPDILSSPKPTSFQLYLEQVSNKLSKLISYNDKGSIRGYKMYWHKENKEWKFRGDANKSRKVLTTPIKPLAADNSFKGKIRFENLSKEELGAFLFVLDLPQGMAHKIGLAKPLGLGSIRITPKLYLSDRKKRYTDLWAEFNSLTESDKNIFNNAFQSFLLENVKNVNPKISDVWQHHRLFQLKKMLDFDNNIHIKNWIHKVSYMNFDDRDDRNKFRYREVLPKPSDVARN